MNLYPDWGSSFVLRTAAKAVQKKGGALFSSRRGEEEADYMGGEWTETPYQLLADVSGTFFPVNRLSWKREF